MIAVEQKELDIILEIIKRLADDCEVYAYGSRYKHTHWQFSDLDLAFKCANGEKLGFKRQAKIKEAFEISDLFFRVDVIDYNAVPQHFRDVIDSGHEVLFSRGDC